MNTLRLGGRLVWLFVFVSLTGATARAHTAAEEMVEAASHWLAALAPAQRAQATFDLADAERTNWHYVPRARKGLPFKEMTPAQHKLAHALLSTGLSQRGYVKAVTIMSLEQVLRDLESGRGPLRDADGYFVSIFGTPGPKGTWGWRVEGHHLSLNFTIVDGQDIAATPSFFGSNPAEVKTGPRQGLRVLANEEDLGRQLVKSLDAKQRTTAILTNAAFKDILTGDARKIKPLEPAGLLAANMSPEQQAVLHRVVEEYVRRHRPEIADHDLEKIEKAGWERIGFVWAGGLDRGQAHYYRVQGPTFVLEYDNTQDNANHIHSVWRDFENDFGEDLLRRHYEETPHGKQK